MADFREYSAAFQDHQNDLAHYGVPKSRWSPEARARYDAKHKKNPVGEMGRNAVRRAKKGPAYNQSSEKLKKMADKQWKKGTAYYKLTSQYDKKYYKDSADFDGGTYIGPSGEFEKHSDTRSKLRRKTRAAFLNTRALDEAADRVKKVEEKRGKAFKKATSKSSKTGSKTSKIAKEKIGEANGKIAMNKKKKQYWGHK